MNNNKTCPTCHQLAVVYKRSLRRALIEGMKKLRKLGVSTCKEIAITDFKILKHWNLIECEGSKIWLTPYGLDFINLRCKAQKHVWLFNGVKTEMPEGEKQEHVMAWLDDSEGEITAKKMVDESQPALL